MEPRNLTLLTDLYELTMMQGYFREKDANETVILMRSTHKLGWKCFSICANRAGHHGYDENLHFDECNYRAQHHHILARLNF